MRNTKQCGGLQGIQNLNQTWASIVIITTTGASNLFANIVSLIFQTFSENIIKRINRSLITY